MDENEFQTLIYVARNSAMQSKESFLSFLKTARQQFGERVVTHIGKHSES